MGAEPAHHAAALDGIRGFAALAVLPYHALISLYPSGRELLGIPVWRVSTAYDRWFGLLTALFNGESAVILFFTLSGLVLSLSLMRDLGRRSAFSAAIAFVTRRTLRIMPAAAASVLVFAIVMWALGRPFTVRAVLENMFLISSYVNGATWTLQAEMLATPALLVAGLLTRRFGPATLWAFVVLAFLVSRKPAWSGALFSLGPYLLAFALGSAIPAAATFVRKAWPLPWWSTLLFLSGASLILPTTPGYYVRLLLAALLIAQIYKDPPNVLCGRVPQLLGRISYSFYLWNVLFLEVFLMYRHSLPRWVTDRPIEGALAASALIALLTIPVAMVSRRYLELPGIELGRRLTSAG